MAYNRLPQTVLAGTALKQNPPPTIIQPAGIVPVTLDADIATTTSLGVVQVGSGLAITPGGVLSATGSGGHGCCSINVYLTSRDYTATDEDCYIGATGHHREDDDLISVVNNVVSVIPIVPVHNIEITLPLGIKGKVYIVKNQDGGNIKVKASGGQKIDTSSFKTLGSEDSVTVVFDGSRWNVIE